MLKEDMILTNHSLFNLEINENDCTKNKINESYNIYDVNNNNDSNYNITLNNNNNNNSNINIFQSKKKINSTKNKFPTIPQLELDKQALKEFKEELNNENYQNFNDKSKFLIKSNENFNSNILNNKKNLKLSNQYPVINQKILVNNNSYLRNCINSPKNINKDNKEGKFDSTINSFKELKNIHESIVIFLI